MAKTKEKILEKGLEDSLQKMPILFKGMGIRDAEANLPPKHNHPLYMEGYNINPPKGEKVAEKADELIRIAFLQEEKESKLRAEIIKANSEKSCEYMEEVFGILRIAFKESLRPERDQDSEYMFEITQSLNNLNAEWQGNTPILVDISILNHFIDGMTSTYENDSRCW